MTAWRDYQEGAAAFFRSIGLSAETDKTIIGVRTSHDVDVLVKSQHYGFEITWIVECKQWKSPVSKLHVLGLREIVADVGADREILLSEAGFQRGAKEAASLTNVQVTSLAEMRRPPSNVSTPCTCRISSTGWRTAMINTGTFRRVGVSRTIFDLTLATATREMPSSADAETSSPGRSADVIPSPARPGRSYQLRPCRKPLPRPKKFWRPLGR